MTAPAGGYWGQDREAPPTLVPDAARELATAGAAAASRDLGIPVPRVRWYLGSAADAAGMAWPQHSDEIWIRCGLTPLQAAMTAIHETRHLWQFNRGWNATELLRKDMEPDAMEYERAFPVRHGIGEWSA